MESSLSPIGLLGAAGTSFFSIWAIFKFILLGTYRLNGDTSKRLFDKIMKESKWTWALAGEYVKEPRYPEIYEAFVLLSGIPFFFSRNERMLTAGWKGKDEVSTLIYFRWQKSKIDAIIKNESGSNVVNISALSPAGQDRLGELIADPEAKIFIDPEIYEDIEEEVNDVLEGKKTKTGCLLYGLPGNGKTQFIKYLSKKYSVPINVVYLNPEYSNYDIARMFAEIPRRCIVLLEDFDNYFNGRECGLKNDKVNFTFDSIINALDGVHNDYRGVIFAMTANDISKIDDSLKKRPSRFKFVREFTSPSASTRKQILQDQELVEKSEGMTLDQVFSLKKSN